MSSRNITHYSRGIMALTSYNINKLDDLVLHADIETVFMFKDRAPAMLNVRMSYWFLTGRSSFSTSPDRMPVIPEHLDNLVAVVLEDLETVSAHAA